MTGALTAVRLYPRRRSSVCSSKSSRLPCLPNPLTRDKAGLGSRASRTQWLQCLQRPQCPRCPRINAQHPEAHTGFTRARDLLRTSMTKQKECHGYRETCGYSLPVLTLQCASWPMDTCPQMKEIPAKLPRHVCPSQTSCVS